MRAEWLNGGRFCWASRPTRAFVEQDLATCTTGSPVCQGRLRGLALMDAGDGGQAANPGRRYLNVGNVACARRPPDGTEDPDAVSDVARDTPVPTRRSGVTGSSRDRDEGVRRLPRRTGLVPRTVGTESRQDRT